MSRVVRGGLGLIAGYAVGAVTGALLLMVLSGNTHDKSLEVTMTAAFVTGPLGAVLGAVIGFFWRRSGSRS